MSTDVLSPPHRARFALPHGSLAWRAFVIQAIVLALIAAFLAWVAANVVSNIARLNINTGFSFLARPAGFEIAQKLISFGEAATYFDVFLVALINTVVLTVIAIVFATLLGFVIGLARLSTNQLVAGVAATYVEVIRNIPLLLQLFYWYFAVLRPLPGPRQSLDFFGIAFLNKRGLFLPYPIFEPGFCALLTTIAVMVLVGIVLAWMNNRHRMRSGTGLHSVRAIALFLLAPPLLVAWLTGFPLSWDVPALAGFNFAGGMTVIPEFVAMAIALSLYGAAYIAEIVRSGIRAVSVGQIDAARALGLRSGAINRFIVIPQALRVILPPLGTQYIVLLKNSSLAAAIAYPDLMLVFAGTVLNQTGQPLEVMLITMASYALIGLAIGAAINLLNRRVQLVER
ncbi:MAG: ABC transporter permease subunit [Alphaproteobacteria bacterium]|nr:MAG: ABC transporter permease subunit [Alphaproteobacteria bacterium]